eukprot:scaffold287_cov119-Isochrysis_galbana.AAC.2
MHAVRGAFLSLGPPPPPSGTALISDLGRATGARFFGGFIIEILIQNTRRDQGLSPARSKAATAIASGIDTP